MNTLIDVLIAIVALFHVYAFVLESLLWQTPRAMRIFGTTTETAATTRTLAVNQGVYNLILATGLFWSLIAANPIAFQLRIFFLICVVVAAVTAGLVVSRRIMLIQGTPALIALILVLVFR